MLADALRLGTPPEMPDKPENPYKGTLFGSPEDVKRESEALWCPWDTIMSRVGGIVPGGTVGIIGASGEGKTALLDHLQAQYVKQGIPSVRFETEMGAVH